MFWANMAVSARPTPSAPMRNSSLVGRKIPSRYVITNRETRNSSRLACRYQPALLRGDADDVPRVLNRERPDADLGGDVEELRDHAIPVVAIAPEASERPGAGLAVLLAALGRRRHLAERDEHPDQHEHGGDAEVRPEDQRQVLLLAGAQLCRGS